MHFSRSVWGNDTVVLDSHFSGHAVHATSGFTRVGAFIVRVLKLHLGGGNDTNIKYPKSTHSC